MFYFNGLSLRFPEQLEHVNLPVNLSFLFHSPRFIGDVLLPVFVAFSEYVPGGFHQIRLIWLDHFQILHGFIADRASAAARPGQAVYLIGVRIADSVHPLIPGFVFIRHVVERPQAILPA